MSLMQASHFLFFVVQVVLKTSYFAFSFMLQWSFSGLSFSLYKHLLKFVLDSFSSKIHYQYWQLFSLLINHK